MVGVKIQRVFKQVDDYQDYVFAIDEVINKKYEEKYATEVFIDGVGYNAFVIEPRSFYIIEIDPIPDGLWGFTLDDVLSAGGIIYSHNRESCKLFVYNSTWNNIYIEENRCVGDFYELDG